MVGYPFRPPQYLPLSLIWNGGRCRFLLLHPFDLRGLSLLACIANDRTVTLLNLNTSHGPRKSEGQEACFEHQ